MSKSYQNYIGINDGADDIYGKTMSIPDALILDYFALAAQALPVDITAYQSRLDSGENPRNLKDELAQKIVSIYYDSDTAQRSAQNFINQFKNKEVPDDIPEMKLTQTVRVIDLLSDSKLCASKGEAKRLIAGGGVKLAGEKIDDPNFELNPAQEAVLQVGKENF